jgi:excisionase family DNA binding protein
MEKFYTPEEIAANLKVTRKTVYNWIQEGRLKAVKIGHFWRVSESELNRLLKPESEPKP